MEFNVLVPAHNLRLVTSENELKTKASIIKAFIFDWDGVFNDGFKDINGGSPFSEVGSMGVNMLRYSAFLNHGAMPKAAIISGRENPYAKRFAEREHLHGLYMGFGDKRKAFEHFYENNAVKPEEVAFVFDDILDLNVAAQVGVRIMIGHPSTRRLQEMVADRGEVDAITSCNGGDNGLREACEFVIDLIGNFEEVVSKRSEFSESYKSYLSERNSINTTIQVNGR